MAQEAAPIKAGPFSVQVPVSWKSGMAVEKVALSPLYQADEWAAFRSDPMNQLKPYYANRPEHWAVRLPAMMGLIGEPIPEKAEDGPVAPQILFHRAEQWSVALTDGKHEERSKAEVLAELRSDLAMAAAGPLSSEMLSFVDGGLDFQTLKKPLKFKGGEGVRLLCQWTIEPSLLCRTELHYLFVGLSDDNSCHVIATIPVTLPGLPDAEPTAEHLGFSLARYEHLGENMATYRKKAVQWLESHKAKLTPRLEELDAMMESIVAETWVEK